MNESLNREDQFLVRLVIEHIQYKQHHDLLERALKEAEAGGWANLVLAVRDLVAGIRPPGNFQQLDAEDRPIVLAILRGLDEAADIPDIADTLDPRKTGTKLATLILAVQYGNAQAAQTLEQVVAAMNASSGEMQPVAQAIIRIYKGERDAELLCRSLSDTGVKIVEQTLAELSKRQTES